jgi:hypothetical protein
MKMDISLRKCFRWKHEMDIIGGKAGGNMDIIGETPGGNMKKTKS